MLLDENAVRNLLHSKTEEIIINGVSIKKEFDDIGYGDFGFWARICEKHSRQEKYKQLGHIDCEYSFDTGALCDCHGCRNKAAYYMDFYNNTPKLQSMFNLLGV